MDAHRRGVAAATIMAMQEVKPKRPFSIVRRLSVMVMCASVATLLLHLVSLVVFIKPLLDESSSRMVSQVHTVETALSAIAPERRDALAAAMANPSIRIGRADPALETPGLKPDAIPGELLGKLAEGTGRHVEGLASADGSNVMRIGVEMPVGGETWWLTLVSSRPSPVWAIVPIATSVTLIGLAAGLTLLLGVRLVTRPMSKLAADMLAGREQLRRIEEPPRVSIELRGVIRSFNALVGALHATERSRRDLLAGISHDLRTPLARLQLRAETECPDDVAAKMEPDLLALSRIVDQFLAYVSGQTGAIHGTAAALPGIARSAVDRYVEEGVDIALHDRGGASVEVADVAMRRVIANLVDNAIAHGRAPIRIELSGDGDETLLMVYDAGTGIAAGSFQHLLQPFVRLEPEVAANGHCGLGLAIVAQVAEQLGGRVVLAAFDGQRSGLGIAFPAAA